MRTYYVELEVPEQDRSERFTRQTEEVQADKVEFRGNWLLFTNRKTEEARGHVASREELVIAYPRERVLNVQERGAG